MDYNYTPKGGKSKKVMLVSVLQCNTKMTLYIICMGYMLVNRPLRRWRGETRRAVVDRRRMENPS